MPNRNILTQPRNQLLSAYPLGVLKDNPSVYLRGNDALGPNARDSTVFNRNGIYSGSIQYQQQSIFTSDPSTGFSCITNQAQLSVTLPFAKQSEYSLEGIFKLNDALHFGGLIKYGDLGTGSGIGVGGSYYNNAGTQLMGLNENIQVQLTGFFLTVGKWYHIVYVNTGGNYIIYVAGNPILTIAGTPCYFPTNTIYIGWGHDESTGRSPHASCSDFALYSYGLSSAQIATHALLAQ